MVDDALDAFTGINQLIAGGDVLSKKHVAKFMESYPQCCLINGYGPTEATTFSCTQTITQKDVNKPSVPIGKPINNTQVYILDEQNHLLPQGFIGQLAIGGDGVADGYYHYESLTLEKFIPDPYSDIVNNKLYLTGDFCRINCYNEVEYHGRIDNQVKIRGFRIECNEIAHVLSTYPLISRACVVIQGSDSQKKLAAYFVANQPALSISSINQYLNERLPEYMVPQVFMQLETLPLNTNGKVDVKNLPLGMQPNNIALESLTTPAEIALGQEWQELLNVNQVQLNDNFFSSGGDSIKAIQLVARMKSIGYLLSDTDIFRYQQFRQLARRLTPLSTQIDNYISPIGAIRLTAIQKWFFHKHFNNPSHWNQWVEKKFAVDINPDQLANVCQKVLNSIESFRLRFNRDASGTWFQQLHSSANITSSVYHPKSIEQATQIKYSLQKCIDIINGPLVASAVLTDFSGQCSLFITAHHLVIDQVSWILIFILIDAALKDQKLMPIPSFCAWAEKQDLINPHFENKPIRLFSIDQNEIDNRQRHQTHFRWTIDKKQTEELKKVALYIKCHLPECLLLILTKTLCDYNSGHSVPIDIENIGRTSHADFDTTQSIGWFTTITTLNCHIEDVTSSPEIAKFKDILKQANLTPFNNCTSIACFNYLGDYDAFGKSEIKFGLSADDDCEMPYLLDFRINHQADNIMIDCFYSSQVFDVISIENIASQYIYFCDQLIKAIIKPMPFALIHSDFPLAKLSNLSLQPIIIQFENQGIEDIYPLTSTQQAMLFQYRAFPTSDAFIVQFVGNCELILDPELFERAWHVIINLHPILRSAFITDINGRPLQVACYDYPFEITWHEETLHLNAGIAAIRKHPFVLSQPCVMRLDMFKNQSDNWSLCWTYHHIILDGWSTVQVLKSVFQVYLDLINQKPLVINRSDNCFGGYLRFIESNKPDLSVWENYLHGFTQPILFPHYHSVAATQDCINFYFNQIETEQIQRSCNLYQYTVAQIASAAWALVLAAYSGQLDIVFGTVVSGRHTTHDFDSSMIIGPCLNTLPQRIKIDSELSVDVWLKSISTQQLALIPQHRTPLEEIQQILPINMRVLFETLLVIENYPMVDNSVLTNPHTIETMVYPLTLLVIPSNQLSIKCYYQLNRINSSEAQSLLDAFTKILTQLLTLPDRPVADLYNVARQYTPKKHVPIENLKSFEKTELSPSSMILSEKILEIWQKILDLSIISIDDDFFNLGGNSLLLMRLHHQLSQKLNLDIPLGILLEKTTIRLFVSYIQAQQLESSPLQIAHQRALLRKKQRNKTT